MAEPPDRVSTAFSREFGEELRRLRKSRGLSGSQLADVVGWSVAKLSKLETGLRGTSDLDLGVLLGACGADQVVRDRIRELLSPDRRAFVRGIEATIDSVLGVGLHERSALSLRCFEPFVVPALLQSDGYMRALFHAEIGFGESHTRAVWARLRRQDVWRYKGTASAFYIAADALSTVVGGPVVMHEQMVRLLEVSRQPGVVVRVVPSYEGLPVLTSRAVEMHVPGAADPLVYVELDAVAAFVDDPQMVRAYRHRFAVLGEVALDPEPSREFIAGRAAVWMDRIRRDA